MPCPKEQPRNQILNFWAIASLQVAWKLLEGRYLVFCIKKYLIWSQALCLAHSFLSLSPHCWIGCCSSFEMQRLVNVWLSGGKHFPGCRLQFKTRLASEGYVSALWGTLWQSSPFFIMYTADTEGMLCTRCCVRYQPPWDTRRQSQRSSVLFLVWSLASLRMSSLLFACS